MPGGRRWSESPVMRPPILKTPRRGGSGETATPVCAWISQVASTSETVAPVDYYAFLVDVLPGDLVVASVFGFGATEVTAPPGWTVAENVSVGDLGHMTAWVVATSSDPADLGDFTTASGHGLAWDGRVWGFRDAAGLSLVSTSSTQASAHTQTFTNPGDFLPWQAAAFRPPSPPQSHSFNYDTDGVYYWMSVGTRGSVLGSDPWQSENPEWGAFPTGSWFQAHVSGTPLAGSWICTTMHLS